MLQMLLMLLMALRGGGRDGGGGGDDDESLLERALGGDARAMGQLVERLTPVIRATVRCRLRRRGRDRVGPHDGDDLEQEVWAHLFADGARVLRNFDPGRANLEAYVTVVARSKVRGERQKAESQRRGGDARMGNIDDMHGVSGGANPEGEAMGHELLQRLREVLFEALPERGRLVFAYLYVDGKKPDEAAALMHVNTQVIYNWQHKIRKLIRSVYTPAPAT